METKPPSGVREKQKLATRQSLLKAARVVLGRKGLANTTTREIAEEAGVGVGTFFVHFKDLGTLIEALLDEHIASTLEKAYRTVNRKSGLVARLVYVAERLFESYDVEPDLSKAWLSGSLFASTADGQLTARLADFRTWVYAQLEEAVSHGELLQVDRELAFTSFFSLYFGILVAGLNGWMTRKQQLAQLEAALGRLFFPHGGLR